MFLTGDADVHMAGAEACRASCLVAPRASLVQLVRPRPDRTQMGSGSFYHNLAGPGTPTCNTPDDQHGTDEL
jgi:hypothetical protein